MIKKCPKCGATEFVVSDHVGFAGTNEDFVEDRNSRIDVLHKSDDDDIWQCGKCGYTAPEAEFNTDSPMIEIFDIVERSLALAGYETVAAGDHFLIIRNSAQDADFRLTLTEEVS